MALERIFRILFCDSPCVVSLQILHYNGVNEYSAKNVKCMALMQKTGSNPVGALIFSGFFFPIA